MSRRERINRFLTEHRLTIGQAHRSLRWVTRAIVGKIELDPESEDLASILAAHPRLVIASNHGPTFGPLASMAGLMKHVDSIGHGHRRFFGVTWRGFYRLPLTREFATLMSGSSGVFSVEEFAETLREGPHNDFLVMPEGDNCNFGDGFEVQPFLSSGFIEIALRAGVPILVVANQGTEAWARVFEVEAYTQSPWMSLLPPRWRERVQDTGRVAITNPLRGRIDTLRFSFQLYQPELSLEELPADRHERRERLQREGAVVRERMQAMVSRMAALEPAR